jgi:hypothetical protein
MANQYRGGRTNECLTEIQLLTPAQVGKILGVTPSTLCRLRQTGLLHG